MPMDYEEMRRLSRTRLGLLWEAAQAGVEPDDEDLQIVEILEQHPEYHHIWEDARDAGGEDLTVDGVNPFLHVGMHQVVKKQLADDNPRQTARTLDALLDAGFARHDAIHAIAAVVVEEIYNVMKSQGEPDRDAYVAGLQELERTAKQRRRRGRRGTSSGRRGR